MPETEFRLRDVAVAAYGPSLVASIGYGAVGPVLALQARALGASVSTAALVVALLPIGMLLASLPAGSVVARLGERHTLLWAGLLDALAMTAAAIAPSPMLLAVAAFVSGAAWTAFLIARQGYMILAVPVYMRARAMSLLGGTFRVGVLVGPLIGAALIRWQGLVAVFLLAAAMSMCAGLLAAVVPDLGEEERRLAAEEGPTRVWDVIRSQRSVLITVGTAVIIIGISRSVRASLLPLWCEHGGISASTTSVIFACSPAPSTWRSCCPADGRWTGWDVRRWRCRWCWPSRSADCCCRSPTVPSASAR